MEHFVLHRFRDDPAFIRELDMVLEQDGEIVAHVMWARSSVDLDAGGALATCTFGPISVRPGLQRCGYGSAILGATVAQAAALGFGGILTEGNLAFYGTLDFLPASTFGIHYFAVPRNEKADFFIARELQPGYFHNVSGTYRDPAGYFVCETDPAGFAAYEATFPPRVRHVKEGQLDH